MINEIIIHPDIHQELNNNVRERAPQVHLAEINDGSLSCFPRFFFVLQTFLSIVIVNVAFIPLEKYTCDPNAGLGWNYGNSTPFPLKTQCTTYPSSNCKLDPETLSQRVECRANCKRYAKVLDHLRKGEPVPVHLLSAYPNPLCFHWADEEKSKRGFYNKNEREELRFNIFSEKQTRAEDLRTQINLAYFWNYSSLIFLMVWAIVHCTHCVLEHEKLSAVLLTISVSIYFLSNFLGQMCISYLKCYHSTIIYNNGGSSIDYDFEPFCDATVQINGSLSINLPPKPRRWTIAYYLYVGRGLITASYLALWGLTYCKRFKIFTWTFEPLLAIGYEGLCEYLNRNEV